MKTKHGCYRCGNPSHTNGVKERGQELREEAKTVGSDTRQPLSSLLDAMNKAREVR